jgi:hypothetical protein
MAFIFCYKVIDPALHPHFYNDLLCCKTINDRGIPMKKKIMLHTRLPMLFIVNQIIKKIKRKYLFFIAAYSQEQKLSYLGYLMIIA